MNNKFSFRHFHSLAGFLCALFALIIITLGDSLLELKWWAVSLLIVDGVLLISTLTLISRQPTSSAKLTFAVPLTPWLPGLSIQVNIYLMMLLDIMTWVRFSVWILIGLAIYFAYGMKNSLEHERIKTQVIIENKQNEGSLFTSSKEILVPTGQ